MRPARAASPLLPVSARSPAVDISCVAGWGRGAVPGSRRRDWKRCVCHRLTSRLILLCGRDVGVQTGLGGQGAPSPASRPSCTTGGSPAVSWSVRAIAPASALSFIASECCGLNRPRFVCPLLSGWTFGWRSLYFARCKRCYLEHACASFCANASPAVSGVRRAAEGQSHVFALRSTCSGAAVPGCVPALLAHLSEDSHARGCELAAARVLDVCLPGLAVAAGQVYVN